MRRNELTIFASLAVIALAVCFWLLVLGPTRQEASDLKGEVDDLQAQVDQAHQDAAAGQQARKSFPVDYRKLVVLGKAVPPDADQSSLLVQLQKLADRAGIEFQSIDLSDATGSTASSAPTSTTPSSSSTASTTTSTTSSTSTSSSAPTTEPIAAATEASAATLPIGASVGPAGLPVMGYDLKFNGGYFQIADFLERVDAMVRTRHEAAVVDGRLITVDAFTLAPFESQTPSPVPTLTADLSVTTYLTPAAQGTTAGATPSGPAPSGSTSATPTPASSATPAPTEPSTSTPASTTTP